MIMSGIHYLTYPPAHSCTALIGDIICIIQIRNTPYDPFTPSFYHSMGTYPNVSYAKKSISS